MTLSLTKTLVYVSKLVITVVAIISNCLNYSDSLKEHVFIDCIAKGTS